MTGPSRAETRRRSVRLWIDRTDHDPSPALSAAAVAGLVTAMLLARFGMPPVNVHSPLHFAGIMDPACGMTRGSAATLRGDLGRAWWYNPASPLVIAGGIAVVVRWFVGRATGRWVCARLAFTRLTVLVVGVAFVALDVYQQLHVDRLR